MICSFSKKKIEVYFYTLLCCKLLLFSKKKHVPKNAYKICLFLSITYSRVSLLPKKKQKSQTNFFFKTEFSIFSFAQITKHL